MKVVIWERSMAREKLMTPRGMEGTMGETVMEMNDRTFPRAPIMAMKTTPLEDLAPGLISNAPHPLNIYPY